MPRAIELNIGDKFGSLTVISSAIRHISKSGRKSGNKYECMCDCGNRGYYFASNLKRGKSTRCFRCGIKDRRRLDIRKGDVFGKLTVISDDFVIRIDGKKTRRRMYECMCECGNAGFYRGNHLVNKYSTQCKICGYKTRPQSALKVSAVERLYNLSIVGRCKKSDRLDNNLPLDEYAKIIKNDCYYCGEPPRKIEHVSRGGKIVEAHTTYANGIDRVDSSLGYSVENCVACCPSCNTMKMDMSIGDFMNKIIQIYNKWELKGTM